MSLTQAPPSSAAAGAEQQAGRLAQLEAHVGDLDRRVDEIRSGRDSWTLISFAVAVVALLAGIIAVGFGLRALDEAERHVEASMAPLAPRFAAR